MSLGSSDMAGSALGTAFSLLLLASIIQGLQNVEVFYYEKMEAVVGQNVTLPCTINTSTDLRIVSIEWSKDRNQNTKLILYSPDHGIQSFWPNVTIRIENNLMGSHLELYEVTKWYSGVYICDIATFPLGSMRRETVLEIKDDKITCNVNSTVEVHAGENVTIQCTALSNTQYRWTKNKKLVSENESLVLLLVTDADTGAYTLTVNTGYKSLHKEFIILVLTATTSLRTDLLTVSPQSDVTKEGLIEPTDSSFTTSPITGPSTTDTSVTYTHIDVTSSPATHTDPSHFNSSNDQTINPTHTFNTATFSDQSVSSNLSTTLSYGSTVTRNDSIPHTVHSEVNSSTSPVEFSTLGNITENSDSPGATPTGNVTVTKDEGMNYNDILQSLAARNGVILSKRHLIRLLKMHGLKRKEYADLGEVIDFIIHQMEGPGRLHGYRWMYNKCLTNGIRAKKEDVRLILAALDPDASATRRSRRLNRRQQGRAETFGGAGAQS